MKKVITVDSMLEEKGFTGNLTDVSGEALVLLLSSNRLGVSTLGKFLPINNEIDENTCEVNLQKVINSKSLMIKALTVGVQGMIANIIENLYPNNKEFFDYYTNEDFEALEKGDSSFAVDCLAQNLSTLTALFDEGFKRDIPRNTKTTELSIKELDEKIIELKVEILDAIDTAYKNKTEDIPYEQVVASGLVKYILPILSLVSLIEVSNQMGLSLPVVAEMTIGMQNVNIQNAFQECFATCTAVKLETMYGKDFLDQLESMAEKEATKQTLH